MKKIHFLLLYFIAGFGIVSAQDQVRFSETVHDFGKITEDGGLVSHEFFISNNTGSPLLINEVRATCGCTTPSWTKEPIEHGKTGKIVVTYNPIGRLGVFSKSITVYTNYDPNPFNLTIKGEVLPMKMEKTPFVPEREYPFAFGNYLLKKTDIDFGKVDITETKTISITAFNNTEKPVAQVIKNLPRYLIVKFSPDTIPAKKSADISFVFDAKEFKKYGNVKGQIRMIVNGVNVSFNYSALIIDNFSKWTATKKENAGQINTNASEMNFGNFTTGNSRTLKISNSGKSTLHIRNIRSSNPCVSISQTSLAIEAGEISEVKVDVDSKKVDTELNAILTIISDDPKNSIMEIPVTAKQKK